ncbi:MAG: choice-of-anchor V domain-containing protein [Chitinophagales bacterium]
MKVKTFTSLFTFVALTGVSLISFKANSSGDAPQPGMTMEPPFYTNCTQCHTTNTAAEDSSKFAVKMATTLAGLSGGLLTPTSQYTPGVTYYMSMELKNNTVNAKRFGFEMSAHDGSDNSAGLFIATNHTNTKDTLGTVTPLNGRSYISHYHANNNKIWIYKWQAPATSVGPVTFYYAGNFADSSLTNDNDYIYYSHVTIGSTVSGIAETDGMKGFQLFPAHAHQVINVSFEASKGGTLSLLVYNLQGQMVKQLFNETIAAGNFHKAFEIEDLAKGVYIVKADQAGSSTSSRFFKN